MEVRLMWDRPIKTVVDKTLRYVYFMDKEHPLGDKKGRVWYHRHVMSIHLGRWLTPQELVHHVDEDRQNNDLSNLEVTTRSEHGKTHAEERGFVRVFSDCEVCGKTFAHVRPNQQFCSHNCSHQGRRAFNPSREELERLVWEMPTSKVAAHYGVSDSAIGKRCKRLGIAKPGRGYWAKRAAAK
jgi:hypothetical protein